MLVATSILLVAAVAAPTPEGATFDLRIEGRSFATETWTRLEGPDGVALSGKVTLTPAAGEPATLTQDCKLARDGHPISYDLDVDAPGEHVTVAARVRDNGYALTITAKGTEEPLESRQVAAEAPVFLLDNTCASHLDAITRRLVDLGAGEERAISVLVPQIMQAIRATVKRGADGKAMIGGKSVPSRSYRLVAANVGTELLAREGDGALLQAEVPMQKAIWRRRGYEPSAAADSTSQGPSRDPRERAIDVASTAGKLPATLLVPDSEAPVAAVLFLSGSGPNDRDETIGPNKPFADIARGLGDRRIASLRFDKRTFAVKDASALPDVRLKDEYYDDAKLAIALLSATKGIDQRRIFVVGHSEGAMVAPNVAAASPGTRGIVMMAPGVRPIDEIIVDQAERGARLIGRDADEIAEQTKLLKDTFAAIRDRERKDTPPFMGAPAAYWRELIALDVPKLVRESKLPILVLQGDQDTQVRKDLDFELLRTRAGDSGGRVTYRSFAGLNHLLMKVEHESTGAEYAFPGHVDPMVITAIADWIDRR
jgi:pimeloyl-ACP methyl ester carboxylesterase